MNPIKAFKNTIRMGLGLPLSSEMRPVPKVTPSRPMVGVGVCIYRELADAEKRPYTAVLLHERLTTHATGMHSFPGGHLEYGESWEECAIREVREECGDDLVITAPEFWTVHNTVYQDEGKHYVTVIMRARWIAGGTVNTEPDKGADWHWYPWDAMPSPLMEPIRESYQSGLRPEVG
jgi:8-oxo-dGTP diphosphatase